MNYPANLATYVALAQECRRLCKLAGGLIRDFSGDQKVRFKGTRDLVTVVDEQVQSAIERELSISFPGSLVLGEETVQTEHLQTIDASSFSLDTFANSIGSGPQSEGKIVWIIDPIDGTNNFIHGFPYYAVSIAATINNVVVAGAIEDVCRDRCYWAHVGGPASCDQEIISTSQCSSISKAMVVGSIPRLFEQYPSCHEIFQSVSNQCQSVRRLGSAALNMAYLADGKLDSYWALSLQIWDVAAGVLIFHQAGGKQRIGNDPKSGGLNYLGSATVELQNQMIPLVDR